MNSFFFIRHNILIFLVLYYNYTVSTIIPFVTQIPLEIITVVLVYRKNYPVQWIESFTHWATKESPFFSCVPCKGYVDFRQFQVGYGKSVVFTNWTVLERSPCGIVASELDCDTVEREFKLQSHYCIHFQTNAPWERYESHYPHSYEINSITTVLLQGYLWHK